MIIDTQNILRKTVRPSPKLRQPISRIPEWSLMLLPSQYHTSPVLPQSVTVLLPVVEIHMDGNRQRVLFWIQHHLWKMPSLPFYQHQPWGNTHLMWLFTCEPILCSPSFIPHHLHCRFWHFKSSMSALVGYFLVVCFWILFCPIILFVYACAITHYFKYDSFEVLISGKILFPLQDYFGYSRPFAFLYKC